MEAYEGSVRKNTAALLCPCLEHRDIDLFQKSSSEYEFSLETLVQNNMLFN